MIDLKHTYAWVTLCFDRWSFTRCCASPNTDLPEQGAVVTALSNLVGWASDEHLCALTAMEGFFKALRTAGNNLEDNRPAVAL